MACGTPALGGDSRDYPAGGGWATWSSPSRGRLGYLWHPVFDVDAFRAWLAATHKEGLTDKIVGMAKAAGAECIAVSCPMCQINLDMRQLDIARVMGNRYNMPILYITQLLGLCLGIPAQQLGLNKLMISPARVVNVVVNAA